MPVADEPIPVAGAGGVGGAQLAAPPTFLEKRGFLLACFTGGWILLALSTIGIYYLKHLPMPPAPGSSALAEYKATIEMYQAASSVLKDSVTFTVDWAVTKTALPVLTLLLGYLFGSKKSS